MFYNSLALRLLSNLYTVFDYSINDLYKIKLNLWTLEWGSYGLDYTIYSKNSINNFASAKSLIEGRLQFPRISFLPLGINLDFRRNDYENYSYNTIRTNFNFNLWSVLLSGSYSGSFTQKANALKIR
jgi:hypothetical protein